MVKQYTRHYGALYNFKAYTKIFKDIANNSYRCSCSHSEVIPKYKIKKRCSYCGKYIFIDKKEEFKYKLEEMLKNEKFRV